MQKTGERHSVTARAGQTAGHFLRDPGFVFNTGYLALFATLIPTLGWAPLALMGANWLCGSAILAHKKNLLPAKISEAINPDSRLGRFLSRKNAVLAVNGVFLLTTGLTAIGLGLAQNYAAAGSMLAQPVMQTAATLLGSKAILSSVFSLGFGISNMKKAGELDNAQPRLHRLVPALGRVKSEFIVALSSLCTCLMTGGWSLLAAPLLLFSMKQSEKNATDPDSAIFRLTRWAATSPYSPFPKGIKDRLYRQHPLTLSRGAGSCALAFSAAVGAAKFAARSVAAGQPVPAYGDLAALGNAINSAATYRLYRLTDSASGDLPKTPSATGGFRGSGAGGTDSLPAARHGGIGNKQLAPSF